MNISMNLLLINVCELYSEDVLFMNHTEAAEFYIIIPIIPIDRALLAATEGWMENFHLK